MKRIIQVLAVCILFFWIGCQIDKNYLEGATQVTVEYFGEIEVNTCRPDLTCDIKDNPKCVELLYKEAKIAAEKGLQELRNAKYQKAAYHFSFALCNVYNVEKLLNRMKDDNYNVWRGLKKDGFIDHIKILTIKLDQLIKECVKLI
jgi:hypothetical protein